MKKEYKVISLYCFTKIDKNLILVLKDKLLDFEDHNISGLLILGEEGINGTICGPEKYTNKLFEFIRKFFKKKDLNEKISFSDKNIFKKLKVRIKTEIVTLGIKDINPASINGIYLDSDEWNQIIEDDNTIIIDTRNHYEVSLGTFKKAINPNTNNFREFPKWIDENLEKSIKDKKDYKIAMFCTGGIRCEKATSLLRNKGYENVFHLKGGILKYLETIHPNKNLYEGECYVFDERVALNHKLKKGTYSICHACGMPISKQEKKRNEYIEGIQCHHCINKFSDKDRARFAERQKQFCKREKVI
ncbi:MAG: hypothetical protein CMK49_02730 [Prochlorococcus sp. SP3034]|nr:hypothetical protein [Prochlorococcus sp. SP3034]|tara:strand:+ start:15739 stop:16647 length:909 start_codon:yes stop_codon:yes gene_type:complete